MKTTHLAVASFALLLAAMYTLRRPGRVSTGALWGNYPQTYSLVGLIQCAGLLSRPWSDAR